MFSDAMSSRPTTTCPVQSEARRCLHLCTNLRSTQRMAIEDCGPLVERLTSGVPDDPAWCHRPMKRLRLQICRDRRHRGEGLLIRAQELVMICLQVGQTRKSLEIGAHLSSEPRSRPEPFLPSRLDSPQRRSSDERRLKRFPPPVRQSP
jgi:hypothetical protein